MKRQGTTILVIDDDDTDRFMIERAFRKNGVDETIHLLSKGAQAIAYLNGEEQYADRTKFEFPSFVITDLKMPGIDGFEVLRHVKSHPDWAVIPMIMLSASTDTNDIKKAYFLGANSYFIKPSDPAELQLLLNRLYNYWIYVEVPQINASGTIWTRQAAAVNWAKRTDFNSQLLRVLGIVPIHVMWALACLV